ncbi:hypothetical protein H5P28_14770 [Ruficoccus amylovorans]|uniref:Uncharacterized protein n=1 Tax=Ruficoccus amylovorans TaxID=1804625 RepID=A0A842HJ47_9BACT|nr:hypothetical protein [Ruficoccus amylovorans]MBC2595527.1 hypothetical protein [Ruficoccus amylovorans]
MKSLSLLFICCCLPILAHAKEHAYGIGNWIRDEHLEVGKKIVIDFGNASKSDDEKLRPDERKEGFVVYWGTWPQEDTALIFTQKKIDSTRSKMIPKEGGVVIDYIYVSVGREREFLDKVYRAPVEVRTTSDGTQTFINDKDVAMQMASNSSKRIDVVLAQVGNRWVVVYK